MIQREQIKKWFTEAVTLDTENPRELKESLLRGHPRLETFIDNLTVQFRQAENVCRGRGTILKVKTIQDTVYDMTKLFMKGMEGEARRRYETDLQKALKQREADKIKEFDAVIAGKPEGEFAEAGVISDEAINKAREEGNVKESVEKSFDKIRHAPKI